MTDAPIPTSALRGTETHLELVRPRGLYERRYKRALDLSLGLLLSVAALPIVVLVALGVRRRLGAGVFYSQQRVGLGGTPFTIWKFRTMRPDRRLAQQGFSDTDRRKSHKVDDDPRHTRFGRLLRKLSLDELPQLWNVLKGDMSLVGPRPEIESVAIERGYLDHPRHTVRPGMTGPYQTSDLRLGGDLRDGLEADVEYVEGISMRGDLTYLLRTVTTMAQGSSQGA